MMAMLVGMGVIVGYVLVSLGLALLLHHISPLGDWTEWIYPAFLVPLLLGGVLFSAYAIGLVLLGG